MSNIQLHDTIALLEDIKTHQFMTDKTIILPKGQMGTVVEEYKNGEAFEVEFSDQNGQTYALISVKPEQFMVLYDQLSELSLTS